jgi:hypothetical protein
MLSDLRHVDDLLSELRSMLARYAALAGLEEKMAPGDSEAARLPRLSEPVAGMPRPEPESNPAPPAVDADPPELGSQASIELECVGLAAVEAASTAGLVELAPHGDPDPARHPDPTELSIALEMATGSLSGSEDVDAMFRSLCDEMALSTEPEADSTMDRMFGELLAELSVRSGAQSNGTVSNLS